MYLVTIYDGIDDNVGKVIHSPFPNGLKLSNASIDLVVEGIPSMDFVINPSNPAWGKVKPLKTLIKVIDTKNNKVVFDGRVLKPTDKMNSDGMFHIEYTCEGKLAYLNDSSQRHGEYHDITIRDFFEVMINSHNSQVEPHKQFKIGNVTVTNPTDNVYRYLGYEKTYASIKDKLIDRLGGYLVIRDETDGMYIDYLESVGEVKNTPIRLRTNLQDMQRETDPLNIITRLVPLGTRIESEDEEATDASQARITIADVNNEIDYLDDTALQDEFGIIEGSVVYDDITQPNILKTRGQQYLNAQKAARVSYDVTPVDLSLIDASFESFECGNWHNVINPVFAIDEPLQIIGKSIDIANPQSSKLTIGEKYRTLTEYQRESNKSLIVVDELRNRVDSQGRIIATIRNEMENVEYSLEDLQQAIIDADLEELPSAISALETAINNLNDALDGIPIYDVATHTEDGLMASGDKVKLDGLENYSLATEFTNGLMSSDDKTKLNRITVTGNIDLDDLLARIETLETQ